jgi:hypothetical protein
MPVTTGSQQVSAMIRQGSAGMRRVGVGFLRSSGETLEY